LYSTVAVVIYDVSKFVADLLRLLRLKVYRITFVNPKRIRFILTGNGYGQGLTSKYTIDVYENVCAHTMPVTSYEEKSQK
jgi:hypothetical protein